jgi:hypothetical protein
MTKEEFNELPIYAQAQQVNINGGPARAGKLFGIAASTIKGRLNKHSYLRTEGTGLYELTGQFNEKDCRASITDINNLKELEDDKEKQKEEKEYIKNIKEFKGNNLDVVIRNLPRGNCNLTKVSFKINSDLLEELNDFFTVNSYYKKQDIFNAAIQEFIRKY